MELTVLRYSAGRDSTLGLLFVDGKFRCYTLEDEYRSIKVYGETRIPAGRYHLKLRTCGIHHARYQKKFPGFHKGMLHVTGVPNFTNILIHIGNDDDDTAGCLLVGESTISNVNLDGRVNQSTNAYKMVYPEIALAIENKEEVWITYMDEVIFERE
ncbi:DUF5675 family protein [Plebeiibacterium marinum]|uniref:DUF5675 family protein n=1 Tax=Plebeiibacterium marinum TaxID=2992111 RepID=A0AAE3MHV0_9BACT|nr:DUF5675 family protein [Plebeiobacterium marinum]MCW3808138.1 DUF5675 family protein [Plebeiobacterium marinum]